MTTQSKARKKSKLRHAEYYDFQNIQDNLYAKSLKGRVFKGLMEIIVMPENIKLAYRNLKKNAGSTTAGTDGRTIYDLAKLSDEQLVALVQRKLQWYVPQSVRRVEIPKGNDPTKKRPLGIPTILDRLIQQCVLQVLEPICEAKFHENNYGFRPNRNQEHAICQAYRDMQISNLHYVVDIDIKGFFDNVNHGKLLKQMWTLGIRDKKVISIISAMLKAEVAGIGFPEKGTPQGGIISPLLSNIVLNELDWWLSSQWLDIKTRHTFVKKYDENGRAFENNKPHLLRKTNLKVCRFVRYADDFKIFTDSYSSAVKLYHATKDWLHVRLGLEISPEKSKIVNLKKHYSDFLGLKMKVIRRGKYPQNYKGGCDKYVVSSHISDKAAARIKDKTDKLIYDIQHGNNSIEAEHKAVCMYNAYVYGIHNYYRMATCIAGDCSRLAMNVQKSLKVRLKDRIKTAREFKKHGLTCNMPKFIKDRYGGSLQMRYVGSSYLIPLGYIQHGIPMMKKWNANSYTAEGRAVIHKDLENVNMEILHYIMRNPVPYRSVEYNDNRLSLYSAQNGKCYVSGKLMEIEEIHCHHKTPQYAGGTDKYQNLVLVTSDVHRLIHATDKEVIHRYLKKLNLNEKQFEKLNKLRNLALVEAVCMNDMNDN